MKNAAYFGGIFCNINVMILCGKGGLYNMTKKILALFLAMAMLLCGCAPQGQEESSVPESSAAESSAAESSTPESTPQQDAEQERILTPEQSELYTHLAENFPKIDGSTSLIPLEAGIRAEIFGTSIENAEKDVAHTTTWGAFKNLLDKSVDMIFSTPISAEQQKMADEAGVKLEQVPVIKEAFVFVVNAKNPVESLSQQQLRDIYSGKITNWSELGGNDEPIVAYQRNYDSGSQNYMADFMGETKLMDAPTELRPGSMSGLMSVIAPNDGAEGSIGYSVYAYAADMYGIGDNIKFIAVDGVAPAKETIISGEYPLSSYNYAIFRAKEPKNGAVRRLAEWMTSYDGQLAAAKAGYATLKDIGFDYAEMKIAKYSAIGAGTEYSGSVPPYEYEVDFLKKDKNGDDFFRQSSYDFDRREDGSYNAGFICNAELRREVESFLSEAVEIVSAEEENMKKFVEECRKSDEWNEYNRRNIIPGSVVTGADVKNGYLSVWATLTYSDDIQEGYDRYYRTETAVWDILSGKRLAPEELFYKDVDIAKALGDFISERSSREENIFVGDYAKKREFGGLPEKGWHITAEEIYFDNDNPYFVYGYRFPLGDLPQGIMVTEQPRAVGARLRMIEENKQFRIINITTYGVESEDGFCTYELLYEDSYPAADKINKFIESYVKENFTKSRAKEYFAERGVDIDSDDVYFDLGGRDLYIMDLGGKYIYFSAGPLVAVKREKIDGDYIESRYEYPYSCGINFDPQTGEEIDKNNIERYG